jgi:hypothetical protein
MVRALCVCLLFLGVLGCQSPPEQVPLKPLPEDNPIQPFADLVTRARVQASAANEAFFVNKWADLEDAAKGLEQTARYLGRSSDVPARHKDLLPVEAGDLGKDAVKLREAAKAQDVTQANELLQRINLKVRELRPD